MKRAKEPYEANVSVASMMPSLYLRPKTEVPVTIGCWVCDDGSDASEAFAREKLGVPKFEYAVEGVDDHV